MRLHTYLNYGGNCADAFRFYERHLGGTITMMMKHGEAPDQSQVRPEWKDAVLHARITIGGTEISAADVPPDRFQPMRSAYLIALGRQFPGGRAYVRAPHRGRADLHADAGDVLRVQIRDAPRQVRHIVDAPPRACDVGRMAQLEGAGVRATSLFVDTLATAGQSQRHASLLLASSL